MTSEGRYIMHESQVHGGAQTIWDGYCESCNKPMDCLDDHTGETCSGAVEYRMPLSGTGRSFPRCDKHWDERLKIQEGINRRYPTHAPADFDPSYAGESWEEDY